MPFWPLQMAHPLGIFLGDPLHIIMEPLGDDVRSKVTTRCFRDVFSFSRVSTLLLLRLLIATCLLSVSNWFCWSIIISLLCACVCVFCCCCVVRGKRGLVLLECAKGQAESLGGGTRARCELCFVVLCSPYLEKGGFASLEIEMFRRGHSLR